MSDIGLLVSVQCTSDIYMHQMKNLGGSIKPAQFHSVKWSTLKAKTRSFMRFESHALREIPSCHIWSFNCWSFCIWPYQIEIETAYTYLHTHTSSYACTGPTWMYGCKCVIRDGSQEMEWDCNGNAYLLFVPQMGSPSRKLTHVDLAENNEKRCGKAVTWATHFVSQQIALYESISINCICRHLYTRQIHARGGLCHWMWNIITMTTKTGIIRNDIE